MREILFRGKDQYNDWIYGYLCQYRGDSIADNGGDLLDDSDYYIRDWTEKNDTGFYGCNYKVRPSTVSQYTGLTDKNGRKIFEGDIVEYPIKSGGHKGENIHEVVFENRHGTAYFGIKMSDIETWGFDMEVPSKLMKVIGNIHDNPELLEADK